MAPPKRTPPRLITVKDAFYLTPNMIRVVFSGEELRGIRNGCDGANCKLMLPDAGETKEAFAVRLTQGPAPVRRTYTVRSFREDVLEMDIDFVAYGDNGPASAWAMAAKAGSFLGFGGPSASKLVDFYADWYLVAADMSALPIASATLEMLPRDAKGVVLFEIETEQDKQEIDIPAGMDVHWIVQGNPNIPSLRQEDFIRAMEWPDGVVQTCIAGESGVIKALRGYLMNERKLPKQDVYVSGYWKIGLIEDQHQLEKRAEKG